MPVPKRKVSKSRRDKRSANKGIREDKTTVAHCTNCEKPLLPHQACRECGYYKGAKVLKTKDERGEKRVEQRKKSKKTIEAESPQEQSE
ncbi:MAG: 50S ribosomal protein L32 [Candidatus Babeliales bacterium]